MTAMTCHGNLIWVGGLMCERGTLKTLGTNLEMRGSKITLPALHFKPVSRGQHTRPLVTYPLEAAPLRENMMTNNMRDFLIRLQRSIDIAHDDVSNHDYSLALMTLDRLSSAIDEQITKENDDVG